jgi:hypothetical protein
MREMFRRTKNRKRMPGFQPCQCCDDMTDNGELVEIVLPSRNRGRWVCPACADRFEGIIHIA